jgi:hypothetical protein
MTWWAASAVVSLRTKKFTVIIVINIITNITITVAITSISTITIDPYRCPTGSTHASCSADPRFKLHWQFLTSGYFRLVNFLPLLL